jgi:ABC-type lipoprotein release transport system permease subunit
LFGDRRAEREFDDEIQAHLEMLADRYIRNVSATDPATFVLIALLLIAVALIASYIPARRAKIDPLQALRHE